MRRSLIFILLAVCLFNRPSMAFAWTDDVEGMLMPTPRGEDNMADADVVTENIEGSQEASSADTAPTIEWE